MVALPRPVWQTVAKIFAHFESQGMVPNSWTLIRQVHLPKPGKGVRESDQAVCADALRPVSVLSSWRRLWGRARLRSQSMSSWVSRWWPEDFYGGRKGVSASDALLPILQSADEGSFVGSLDFSLAFDSTDPRIPLHVFHQLGMPHGVSSMLTKVWRDQTRFLQLAGDTDPIPCKVQCSLPQGDALSMLGLAAALLSPHLDIKKRFPRTKFATYVDDRTFASPSASDCVNIDQAWGDWSHFLSLRENSAKTQFFRRTVQGRTDLIAAGAQPDRVLLHPKILGVQFSPAAGRAVTNDEDKRFRKATVLARRCSYLPHSHLRKTFFASVTAVSVAKWGWVAKIPPKKVLGSLEAALRCCAAEHRQGDPFLRKIFRGHLASPDFACFSAVTNALYRFCKRHQNVFGSWYLKSGFAKTIRSYFARFGCKVVGPWTWHSLGTAAVRISFQPSSPWFPRTSENLQHSLREIWRRFLYEKWTSRFRIDSRLAGNIPYSEARCAAARSLAVQSLHRTAVLVGASVSPAKLAVMLQNGGPRRRNRKAPAPVHVCPFCRQEGADLNHVVWECTHRRDEGGPRVPSCPLQKRLGWPKKKPPDFADNQVLDWQVYCRKLILQERWH